MNTVGIRELRRYASRWLARVKAGETFVITDRGRPVARISPVAQTGGYENLLAEGRIAPGTGRPLGEVLAAMDADIPPDQGPALSEILAEMREGER
jgi:prevent-host-death family protein